MKISIKDVAEKSGVSMMTVSRVFNPAKSHLVKESTRRKVLAVAEKYDYHPVISGRSFVTGRSYKIGLILGLLRRDFSSPFFARFVEGLINELQSHGYSLTLLHFPRYRTDGNELLDLLRSKVADGYILDDSIVLDSVKGALRGAPLLMTGHRHEETPLADVPHFERCPHKALRELWQTIPLKFRQSVALLTLPFETEMRRSQLIRDLAPEGSQIKEFSLDCTPDFYSDRYNTAQEIKKLFPELRRYKVLWCINDFCALGAADICRENGLIPGKDIFIIGFDNLEELLSFSKPFLTTVDSRWDEVGRKMAGAMLKILNGEPVPPEELTIDAEIIRRQSL